MTDTYTPVLTDERIQEIWVEHGLDDEDVEGFARAVERAAIEAYQQRQHTAWPGQPSRNEVRRALEILEIAAAEAAVCGGDASGISRVADWMRVILGTAAWADVPDATAWVEDLRGDDDGQRHATESLLLGRILAMWNNGGETSDLDGAWLQDAVIASGLAVQGDKGYVLTPRAMELIGAAAGKQR